MSLSNVVSAAALTAAFCVSLNAGAIPLPDSGVCTGSVCLTIANSSTSGPVYAMQVLADTSANGVGILGSGGGASGTGVYGSGGSIGVLGYSPNGNGLYAYSMHSDGIVGLAGTCTNCSGVWGKANGAGTWAFYGSGDVKLVSATGQTGSITIAGSAKKPNGGPWDATSDMRVKKDISNFTVGLDDLVKVQPVRFKYNGLGDTEDTGKVYVGVIAQDLEKIFPSMVSSTRVKLRPTDKQPVDLKQVSAGDFTFMLINAVKELNAQNKQILEQNKELVRQTNLLTEQGRQMADIAKLVCQTHPTSKVCINSHLLATR